MTHRSTALPGYEISCFDTVMPVECPCGQSRRAFISPDSPASFHVVDAATDTRAHYHRVMTEIYYVLETDGPVAMELDGRTVPVTRNTAILIRPGTRHRIVGKVKFLNVVIPPHREDDEYFD